MTRPLPPALPDTIRVEVAKALPRADVDAATPLGAGIATWAYRLHDPSGPWVVRVSNAFPEPWTWRGGRGYEVSLLAALAREGMPVPRDPFAICADDDGAPVAVVEREAQGAPCGTAPRGQRRVLLARQLAEFLARLHRFPIADAHAFGVPSTRIEVDLRESLEQARPFLGGDVQRWLEAEIGALEPPAVRRALVHRDIRLEHLFLNPDGCLVGVIDFGDTTIDDPALDVAKITDELGDDFLPLLLEHYDRPGDDGFLLRAQAYRRLHALFEVADPDGWGDRPDAVRRLTELAARSPHRA